MEVLTQTTQLGSSQSGTDGSETTSPTSTPNEMRMDSPKKRRTTRGTDPCASFSQENKFEPAAECCSVISIANSLMPGDSARVVFDAMVYAIQNMEIITSEVFGTIMIREDTDFDSNDFALLRFVLTTPQGATTESNSVVFTKYVDSPDGGYGIVCSDYIDSDDLYPYRPKERVRRDTTILILIRAVQKTAPDLSNKHKHVNSNKAEMVIVATSWMCTTLLHAGVGPINEDLRDFHFSMEWWEKMKKYIVQYWDQRFAHPR
ncbi:unnamed protein product [Phytophthora lilii]|uniref:Unnamed protein product n=1 Tax=Phytophthora lilii TaxID=2077276 RepID=A0A9W6WNY0_9STRA|nr:unnamed protein product [Phytophthora lilii]